MKKIFAMLLIAVASVGLMSAKGNGVTELSDAQYKTLIVPATKPYVIDFSATWCGPCKMFAPVFHQVAEQYADKVDFYSVDVDRNKTLAAGFQVRVVPTIVIYNPSTKKSKRLEGVVGKDDFIAAINSVM